jgi:uncharacterized membrane protein YebE (DUF533 family)
MIDATKLLGALMESRAAPSAGGRMQNAIRAIGGGQAGGAGGLGGLLGGLLGGGGAGGTPQRGGAAGGSPDLGALLGRVGEMARQAANDPVQGVRGNNPVAVGGLGALAGALLGGGRGRGAVAGGLLAVLGSLAYQAMQQGHGAQAGAAAGTPALPQTEEELQHESRLVLRAVIQAAQADGRVDGAEIGRILDQLQERGEDPEARAFVEAEMLKAPDVEALAREVRSPEQAARLYAASLLAIEVDTQAERDHLARLAAALRLPPEAVARIHQGLGVPA